MATGLQAEELGGLDSYADTVRIRVLPESVLQQPSSSAAPERGFDPYSTDVGAVSASPRPRRTLDDMRRLSEAIIRNRRAAK